MRIVIGSLNYGDLVMSFTTFNMGFINLMSLNYFFECTMEMVLHNVKVVGILV